MSHNSDPIGDLLTRMRNAQHARRQTCRASWSRIKQELCDILKREGWIAETSVVGEGVEKEVEVTFIPGKTLEIKRASKPGRRMYKGAKSLGFVQRGYGQSILTTSEGLLTDKEARKKNVGGEVLCTVS